MSSIVLDTAKFVWDVMKDGMKINAGTAVNVMPQGTTRESLGGWNDNPVGFPEKFEELSFWFDSPVADLTITPNWNYNMEYIYGFNVMVEGTVDVLSNVDVTVTTFPGYIADDGVAELPYHIDVVFKNLTSGTQRKTIRAIARGDGGGRSLA